MLPTNKQDRKERPIATGVLGYFPDAIAEVAYVSYVGNQQHNPGQPMHWARHKSTDHADCVARHLIERGTIDDDGLRHTAKVAWRALALLQTEIEDASENAAVSGGTGTHQFQHPAPTVNHYPVTPEYADGPVAMETNLRNLGCPADVADGIVGGTTFVSGSNKWCYIAGPMRGYEQFNFPAFDEARQIMVGLGYNVISPADIDRYTHPHADDPDKVDVSSDAQAVFAFRDFWSLYYIRRVAGNEGAIVMLDNWPRSTGASAEMFIARWLGLRVLGKTGGVLLQPVSSFCDAND